MQKEKEFYSLLINRKFLTLSLKFAARYVKKRCQNLKKFFFLRSKINKDPTSDEYVSDTGRSTTLPRVDTPRNRSKR